jgi:hypothetical protein
LHHQIWLRKALKLCKGSRVVTNFRFRLRSSHGLSLGVQLRSCFPGLVQFGKLVAGEGSQNRDFY